MMIDTHCHLFMNPLGGDIEGVRARAAAAGVTELVVPAYDLASWNTNAELQHQEGIHTAVGLHPWVANQVMIDSEAHDVAFRERLASAIEACGAVAVGEIGLDFLVEQPGHKQQLGVLHAQLRLAVDLDLPVILHCRSGWELLVAAIQPYAGTIRGVMHAYTRTPGLAGPFLRIGFYVGLGGTIVRPTALRARNSAKVLPLDRILLETDAPATGIGDRDPASTEPRHVREVAETLASLRETTIEEIGKVTTANAREFFGI